jgi:hypothetical protein
MQLRADVLPEGFEELVERGGLDVASIDRPRDVGGLACLSGGPEELDVGEGFVEERELFGPRAAARTHDLAPGLGERHCACLATLCVDGAPNTEEPCDELRKDDQRCAESPTERVHDSSPPFMMTTVRRGPDRHPPDDFFPLLP